MGKNVKGKPTNQKIKAKIDRSAIKEIQHKAPKVKKLEKNKRKEHIAYLRGLEKRKAEIIIANRATHNSYQKELEETEAQIRAWKEKLGIKNNGDDASATTMAIEKE